jgi:hypothetical protein
MSTTTPEAGAQTATLRIAVDIGGTFTDVAAFDESSGQLLLGKWSSTPRDLVEGILRAIAAAGGDLLATRADELRRGVVEALDRVLVAGMRLVAADSTFQLEVADHGVEHRLRRQRRAGVVEVQDVVDAGRLGAGALDVDRHASGMTATPGSSLPSRSSSAAPPPVDAQLT